MRSLPFVDQRDGDGHDGVALRRDEEVQCGLARVPDGDVRTVEPGLIDAQEFLPRSCVRTRSWEEGGDRTARVWSRHHPVSDFEVHHIARQWAVDGGRVRGTGRRKDGDAPMRRL